VETVASALQAVLAPLARQRQSRAGQVAGRGAAGNRSPIGDA
jgi:hypothetical protein